jgi:hypothetical protein
VSRRFGLARLSDETVSLQAGPDRLSFLAPAFCLFDQTFFQRHGLLEAASKHGRLLSGMRQGRIV